MGGLGGLGRLVYIQRKAREILVVHPRLGVTISPCDCSGVEYVQYTHRVHRALCNATYKHRLQWLQPRHYQPINQSRFDALS